MEGTEALTVLFQDCHCGLLVALHWVLSPGRMGWGPDPALIRSGEYSGWLLCPAWGDLKSCPWRAGQGQWRLCGILASPSASTVCSCWHKVSLTSNQQAPPCTSLHRGQVTQLITVSWVLSRQGHTQSISHVVRGQQKRWVSGCLGLGSGKSVNRRACELRA